MGNSPSFNRIFPVIREMSIEPAEERSCAYCGKKFSNGGWPHIEGDSNRGVLRIEHFCCEEHKIKFLSSR